MQDPNLSWSHSVNPRTKPPSIARPRQPTIYAVKLRSLLRKNLLIYSKAPKVAFKLGGRGFNLA